MVLSFCKEDDNHANIHPLVINGTIIDCMPYAKVLGVTTCISGNLCWNTHVANIVSKESKRKRADSEQKNLLKIYLSVIRPVLEYMYEYIYIHQVLTGL